MSCLAHDKRFCSSFHHIINELRNENRMPVSILRTMPNRCCTCHDENKDIMESVMMKEENQCTKLKNLIERVNREKQTNPKLILSLNRFENLIEQNRGPAPVLSVQKRAPSSSSSEDSSSSSDSEDTIPMEISKPSVRDRKKPPKPIKNGTFLFLPYETKSKTTRKDSNSLLDVAKTLQRNRFIGRLGHIGLLEKQYDVRINMITPKTSQQVTEALENAKKGLDKLTIHNKNQTMKMSEKKDGEWILIRSKKPQKQTNSTTNIEKALEDLTSKWESCLTITKRENDESHDSSHLTIKKRKTFAHFRTFSSSDESER
jgi:hypothetical protein